MGQRNYQFDAFMQLDDGVTAHTVTGQGTVGGLAKYLDLGGPITRTDINLGVGALARLDAVAVADITALNVANTNNLYTLYVMGSESAALTSPTVLAAMPFGNTAALPNGATTSTVGRYEIPFTTEQADQNFEFIFLYIVAAGTAPSILARVFVTDPLNMV